MGEALEYYLNSLCHQSRPNLIGSGSAGAGGDNLNLTGLLFAFSWQNGFLHDEMQKLADLSPELAVRVMVAGRLEGSDKMGAPRQRVNQIDVAPGVGSGAGLEGLDWRPSSSSG